MAIRPSRAAGLIAGCAVLAGVAAPTAAAQVYWASDGDHATIQGSAPSWAVPAAKVGTVDPAQVRHVQVALGLRDQRGAEALAKAVSTPGSAQHGKFLSTRDFLAKFGPTQDTLDRVSAWL